MLIPQPKVLIRKTWLPVYLWRRFTGVLPWAGGCPRIPLCPWVCSWCSNLQTGM